jgi:hypothetical protein
MANYYDAAGQFFDKAYASQSLAAAAQRQKSERYDDDADINPYSTALHTGSVPPDVNQGGTQQGEINNYITDVKEDLISQAKEKRRPVDGEPAYRAGGGINYAVKR